MENAVRITENSVKFSKLINAVVKCSSTALFKNAVNFKNAVVKCS